MASSFWNHAGAMPTLGLDFDLARLLHGGQEFVFHGPPPRTGTTLIGQMRVSDAYEKEGRRGGTMSFIEVVTDFHDTAGTLVAEAKIVLIVTGQAPTEAS